MSMTVEAQITKYLVYCKEQKLLSKNTLRAYHLDFNQFIGFLQTKKLDQASAADIQKEDLRVYIKELLLQYATRTCKRKIACIKAFYNYLEYEDIIDINPFRKIKVRFREPRRLPKAMSSHEIESVLTALYTAHSNQSSYRHSFTYWRNIACVELLFSSGMRVGELCDLKASSVDLTARTVRIIGKGNKERIVYIASDDAIKALQQYEVIRNSNYHDSVNYFISDHGKRYSETAVRKLVHQYASKLLHRRITPHMFRHSFASLLLNNNVDIKIIQELLGHSSIITTQIYLHLTTGRLRDVLMEFHPRCAMSIHSQPAI